MPIRRRLQHLTKIPFHVEQGPLSAGPRHPFPSIVLPNVPRFTMGLPLPLKGKQVYIGSMTSHHWSRFVKMPTGHYKVVKPTSGLVGFSLWLTKQLIVRDAIDPRVIKFHAWDAEEGELVPVCTHYDYGQFAERIEGKIDYVYHESFFASDEQEEAFWDNTNAFNGWPDWLHKLYDRAYNSILHAAESEFELKRKWGKKR